MSSLIVYRPLTATPFKRNNSYSELTPCKELYPYIRCYWGIHNARMVAFKDVGNIQDDFARI